MSANKDDSRAVFGPGFAYGGDLAGHTGYVTVTWAVEESKLPYVALALLAALLDESPKAFKDTRTYLKKTMKLNDASIDFSAGAIGGWHLLTMEISFVKDFYAHKVLGVERQVLRLAEKIIAAGPKTDAVALTLAKGKLLRANADARGSLRFKARLGLLDNFLPAYAKIFRAPLDDNRLKSLQSEHIKNAADIIFKAPSFVAVTGSRKALAVAKAHWATLITPLSLVLPTNKGKKSGDVEVADDQSKATIVSLAYALKGRDLKSLKQRVAGLVLTDMLQNSDSPLFTELREKGGFTYSPSVAFLGNGNVLVISFITDRLKKTRALKTTEQLLTDIGAKLTPAQFVSAQNSCLKQYESSEDFPETIARLYAKNLLLGTQFDLAQLRQALGEVTLAEVQDLLAGLQKIGSYSLVGNFAGGE